MHGLCVDALYLEEVGIGGSTVALAAGSGNQDGFGHGQQAGQAACGVG